MKPFHKAWFRARPRWLVAWCLSISWGMAQQPAASLPDQPAFAASSTESQTLVSAVPALAGGVVKQEKVTPSKDFETLELYWWQSVKQPEAVLVLADEKARTDVFMSEAWVGFLKAHRWSVLVVGVKSAGAPPLLEPVVAGLEQTLFACIDAKYSSPVAAKDGGDYELEKKKGPLPLLFHASGSAAFWMESVMLRKPSRFAAWLAVDPQRFPEIPRTKEFLVAPGGFMPLMAPLPSSMPAAMPAGVKKYYEQLDHFEELRSRNEAARISFVPWTAASSVALRDSFARMYLESAFQAEADEHLWLNVNTLQEHPLTATDKLDPTRFGWLPSQNLVGAVKALRPAALPPPLPGQDRRFFKSSDFASCDLRWIRTVPKPTAILVIAANALPAHIRSSSDWIDYAKKHEWAVLMMGLKEDRIRLVEEAATNLEAYLYQEIDNLAGPESKGLPLITYAQGTSALWLQTLMLRQPSRYLGWIALGAPRFPSVTTAFKVPPGLVISQNASQFGHCIHHFEDLRTADPYNPVCFLPLSDTKPPGVHLEAAYRAFLDAAVSAKKENVRWVHLHSLTPPPSSITSRPEPRHYAWFPRPEILGIWKALRQDTIPMPLPVIVKRSFKTKIAEVPELKLFIRIPGTLMKGQSPNGVLCFCTWQQEDTTLINRLKNTDDSLVAFADRHRMAMITWNTASMLPADAKVFNLTPELEADLRTRYSAFGEEWSASIKKVCHEFKLQDKDMLLHGVSRGAAFAHQISMKYPQRFLAVHTHIGGHYNEMVPKEAKDTFWLVTTGDADGGYRDSFEIYSKFKELGAPTLFKAGESLGHASRRDIEELGTAFFTYALDLRSRCEKEKARNRTFKDTPVSLFQKAVAAPPWFGDYINHQAFQAGNPELESIPVEQRMPLPTEDIAKAWGMSLEAATAKKEPPKNFAAGK